MTQFKLEEVFGLSRQIPLTYTTRDNVDNLFVDSLSKESHIVIFGCSKQGKTSLRKKHLHDHERIIIQCDYKITLSDIHKQILKEVGFKQIVKETKGSENAIKTNGSVGANMFSFLEAKGQIGFDKTSSKNTEEKHFEIDINNVNDIVDVLKQVNFSKYVIIEDFHYLQSKTQKEIAFALKSYYDNLNIVFIIVGVWLEENKLINLNRDLIGRMVSINADTWKDEDLIAVIKSGCELLNIEFENYLIDRILDLSFGSVYFVQELCYSICKSFKIDKTLISSSSEKDGYHDDEGNFIEGRTKYFINQKHVDFNKITSSLISQYSSHYNSFLVQFDDNNDNNEVIKFILLLILRSDPYSLVEGIKLKKIIDFISKLSPQNKFIDRGTLIRSLKSINTLQFQKGIMPSIIDFDDSSLMVNIIDKGFLIWLNLENRLELESVLNFKLNQQDV